MGGATRGGGKPGLAGIWDDSERGADGERERNRERNRGGRVALLPASPPEVRGCGRVHAGMCVIACRDVCVCVCDCDQNEMKKHECTLKITRGIECTGAHGLRRCW